jgi:hypothetical protein
VAVSLTYRFIPGIPLKILGTENLFPVESLAQNKGLIYFIKILVVFIVVN